ncbi:MAG TPA: hypothetical protein VGK34_01530 [Armatimonadota bacterium]|jgi:hypothetical protein
MVLHIIVGLGIALVIGLLIHQISGWKKGCIIVTREQRVYRVAEAALLVTVLGMIFAGDKAVLDHFGKLAVIYYWTICFGLAVALTILAMLDVRAVGMQWGREREAQFRDLLGLCDEDEKKEE